MREAFVTSGERFGSLVASPPSTIYRLAPPGPPEGAGGGAKRPGGGGRLRGGLAPFLRAPFLRAPFLRAPFLRAPFLRAPFLRARSTMRSMARRALPGRR